MSLTRLSLRSLSASIVALSLAAATFAQDPPARIAPLPPDPSGLEEALIGELAARAGSLEPACGTVATPAMAAIARQLLASGAWDPPTSYAANLTGVVPIAFHIVRNSSGSGGYAGDIFSFLNSANQAFSGSGLSFCEQGQVDFINNTLFMTVDNQAEADALRQVSVVPNCINVWIVDQLFIQGFQLAGLSSFTFSPVQGIIMDKDFTPFANAPSTWPHEVGHYFDLFHTDEFLMFPIECTSGSNCATAGDLVCDTPADPGLQGLVSPAPQCAWMGGTMFGPCAGDPPYLPDIRNFLGFAPQLCRDHFTAGQKARAFNTFANLRPELQLGGCVRDPVELFAFPPAVGDHFGTALDLAEVNGLNNKALVVGSPDDDPHGNSSGAAYTFEMISNTGWFQDEVLVPATLAAGEQLGKAVAFDGFTTFLGAPEGNGARGAVYVFERQGQFWSERQKLTLAGAPANARFGGSVDVHGNWGIVGAVGDAGNQGSATIFQRNTSGVWNPVLTVYSTDSLQSGGFATSVSLSGNTAVVGSPDAWTAGIGTSGAVFVYDLVNGVWTPTTRLVPPGLQFVDEFGASVSIFGDTLLAGAPGDDDLGPESGSAHVFVLTTGTWQHRAKLTAPGGTSLDEFGESVSVAGNLAIVGAPFADSTVNTTGAAYRYSRTGMGWVFDEKLVPPSPTAGDQYGTAVAIEHRADILQDDIAIGALLDNSAAVSGGAVHAYQKINSLSGLTMTANVTTISVTAGGQQLMTVSATPFQASQPYQVLGSFLGTDPGQIISAAAPALGAFQSPHSSYVLPLNKMKFFPVGLKWPNPPILLNASGTLDANGQAVITFNWPAGHMPNLVGMTFHHALTLPLDPFFSSNTTSVTLVP